MTAVACPVELWTVDGGRCHGLEACREPRGAVAVRLIHDLMPFVNMSANATPYTDASRAAFTGVLFGYNRWQGPASRASPHRWPGGAEPPWRGASQLDDEDEEEAADEEVGRHSLTRTRTLTLTLSLSLSLSLTFTLSLTRRRKRRSPPRRRACRSLWKGGRRVSGGQASRTLSCGTCECTTRRFASSVTRSESLASVSGSPSSSSPSAGERAPQMASRSAWPVLCRLRCAHSLAR